MFQAVASSLKMSLSKMSLSSSNHSACGTNHGKYDFDESRCKLTEERLDRARGSAASAVCTLTPEELTALQEEQHNIAAEDDLFSPDRLRRDAKLEERARVEVRAEIKSVARQLHQAADTARRRTEDISRRALGVQPTASLLMTIENSLIAGPGPGNALSASVLASLDEAAAEEESSDGDEERKVDDGGHLDGQHDALYKRKIERIHFLVENNCADFEDCTYVRKPNLARIISQRDRERPKYTLKKLLTSRRFHLYKHRFLNAQYKRTFLYPTLPQPGQFCGECIPGEMERTRAGGHRFVLAADTQFGILMDGYAYENPNWGGEIEVSRRAVAKINAMKGADRPLYVCVCGDLVDTESSFSRALASWKKIMSGWERTLVFEQQVKDFKNVWSLLDADIALVCLCGNHDVGNRPTEASIGRWTSSFGDDYLAFWVNGTYNIALNNCLFSDPTGAPNLFKEQLLWLEERLAYAKANDATHIFVYSHFPWFLKHELETDDEISTFSDAPEGWGPAGTKFPDNYFTIPFEERQVALLLFRKYGVTACFSGHYHQNVVAKTTWGMDMIVTGPLSMTLRSEMSDTLSGGEPHGIGMRIVDVGESGKFTHKFSLLDDDN